MLVQLLKGYTNFELGKYLLWYVLPTGFDMILLAVLAVFVQSLSPNKYVGWGVMVLYIVSTIVAQFARLRAQSLPSTAASPQVRYSDINGAGTYWKGAWWFRLYWARVRDHPAGRSPTCCGGAAPRRG